jgi:hypothetical protein
MNEKLLLFIIVLVISVAFLFSVISTTVIAYGNANDTVTIDVNVSSVSQITLFPDTLTWTNVDAGTNATPKNITLKNTGSLSLTDIYAYVGTLEDESLRPYGSGNPGKYSAGGVLVIRNETNTSVWPYYNLGRIEWNWTVDIPNHNWGNVTSPVAWGYFTNLTNDYVWVLGNGTNGFCNNTATQFAIEDHADVGTLGTRSPDKTTISPDDSDGNWTYFSINRTSSVLNHTCVAAYYDCSKIYIYKFDERNSNPDFAKCANAAYLYNGGGTEGTLMPGDTIIFKVSPWVPHGTPSGDLNTTTLTVIAS